MAWTKKGNIERNKSSMPHLIIAASVFVYTIYCNIILGKAEIVSLLFTAWVLAEFLFAAIIGISHKKPMERFNTLIKILQIGENIAYMFLIIGIILYLFLYDTASEDKKNFINEVKHGKNQCVLVLGAQPVKGEMDEKLIGRLDYLISIRDIFDESCTEYIVSGGTGRTEHSDITEAELMQEYLLRHGFPAEKLSMESSAISTYENLIFTRDKWQNSELVVVTSDYHLPRVKVLLDDLGCEKYRLLGAPTDKGTKPYMMLQEMIGIAAWKMGIY